MVVVGHKPNLGLFYHSRDYHFFYQVMCHGTGTQYIFPYDGSQSLIFGIFDIGKSEKTKGFIYLKEIGKG